MKLLLSNDDGYFAPGIQMLLESLAQHKSTLFSQPLSQISVVAPDRNRSAASNALTLMSPLRLQQHNCAVASQMPIDLFGVNGTPTDCVHLAVNGALGFQPDVVVSGINAGANMGDDVLYSGTVAAATEGRFLSKPSVAISLCGEKHFKTAAKVFLDLFCGDKPLDVPKNTVININVPDLPYDEIQGVKITRLGKRHASEPVIQQLDPRGQPIHWIGPAGQAEDATIGTDFHAVEHGFVSITPLMIDLTAHQSLQNLEVWLNS